MTTDIDVLINRTDRLNNQFKDIKWVVRWIKDIIPIIERLVDAESERDRKYIENIDDHADIVKLTERISNIEKVVNDLKPDTSFDTSYNSTGAKPLTRVDDEIEMANNGKLKRD